jgi:phosphohistidine phosphatase
MSEVTNSKFLVVIRHAKAAASYEYSHDRERPLTKQGQEEALKMASWVSEQLASRLLSPDLLLTSPALRTAQTAHIFSETLSLEKEKIQFDEALYLPEVQSFYSVLEKINDKVGVLILFSHNNGLTDFVNSLTNNRIDVLPPCGVVGIELADSHWKNIQTAPKNWLFFKYPAQLGC